MTGRGSRVPGVAVATRLWVPGACSALGAPGRVLWPCFTQSPGENVVRMFLAILLSFLVLPSWVYSGFRSFLRQHPRTVWPLNSNSPVSVLGYLSCFPCPLLSDTFLRFYFLLHLMPLCVFTGQLGESALPFHLMGLEIDLRRPGSCSLSPVTIF